MKKLCIKCKRKTQRKHNSYCKGCHNEYQKKYYREHPESINRSSSRRKDEIRKLIKRAKDIPCKDCKQKYSYFVMDFDHVRGKKKFNLSVAANRYRSIELVELEIKKCDVVCANCHRLRTMKRQNMHH